MVLIIKIQNLQQKNGKLLIMNQKVIIHTKIQYNFLTKSIESSLCDYSDAYILVTVDIAVKKRNNTNNNNIDITQATQVVFKNCAPFNKGGTEINEILLMKQILLI